MDKRTVASAHERIDGLEKEVIAMQTEMRIQFKDLFGRVKRMEAIMIGTTGFRSEEHTSELQSRLQLVCRPLLEKKKRKNEAHPGRGPAEQH